jgi:hypothetical protein
MELQTVIRDYTHRIQQLQHELAALKETNQPPPFTAANSSSSSAAKQPLNSFSQVHLLFCQLERQVAAETLFFLAYHTQLTTQEMASLMDLIRDLSAMTPRPCPFTNVPSPYEPTSTTTTTTTAAAYSSSTAPPFSYALQEKSPLVWQREFVADTHQSGQPQLLQCISLLVVAAMAAMDTRQVLYDRQLHGPNAFGKVRRRYYLLYEFEQCNTVLCYVAQQYAPLSHTIFVVAAFSGKSIFASRQSILGWNHRTPCKVESSSQLSMGPPRYLGCLGSVLCPPLTLGTDTVIVSKGCWK